MGYFFLNLFQATFLGLWSAFWISFAGFVSIFHRELPLVMARHGWAPGLIRASLIEVRVEPGAVLDRTAPYVFVMNHQSMFDVAVAFAVIPRNIRFVAKSVLKWVPFIGFFIWRTGMVFVDRKHPASAYENLDRAVRRLREGACFLAFPEGTRTIDGRIKPFKRGPFITALRAGASIVPVAADGSWRLLPRGGFKLRPGVVRVRIGAPISTAGRSEEDAAALVKEARDAMIALHLSIGGAGGVLRPEESNPLIDTGDVATSGEAAGAERGAPWA